MTTSRRLRRLFVLRLRENLAAMQKNIKGGGKTAKTSNDKMAGKVDKGAATTKGAKGGKVVKK